MNYPLLLASDLLARLIEKIKIRVTTPIPENTVNPRPFSPIVYNIYFLTRKTCFRFRDEQKAITMHNAMYLPEGNAFPYLQASKVPTYLDNVDN